jgi:hypothetical protein
LSDVPLKEESADDVPESDAVLPQPARTFVPTSVVAIKIAR